MDFLTFFLTYTFIFLKPTRNEYKKLPIFNHVLPVPAVRFSVSAQEIYEKPPVSDKGTYYNETPIARYLSRKSVNPLIADYIEQLSSDSVRSIIQDLQDFGSRYMLNEDRKVVAEWIMQKFLFYGYTNVVLDSFLTYFADTLWQYNIVCTMAGSSAPNEVYVVGGHYDTWCLPDPFFDAPGANDNASSVAATLEMACIMKKNNYQPQSTIKFMIYAAEEKGLFGSFYHAQKARETGEDVRYMLNMDMISNNPDSINEENNHSCGNFFFQLFHFPGVYSLNSSHCQELTPTYPKNS